MDAMECNGHIEVDVMDDDEGVFMIRERHASKLVVTGHSTRLHPNPDEWTDSITRQLERFMRDNCLSRLECYWNAIPPEEPDERSDD